MTDTLRTPQHQLNWQIRQHAVKEYDPFLADWQTKLGSEGLSYLMDRETMRTKRLKKPKRSKIPEDGAEIDEAWKIRNTRREAQLLKWYSAQTTLDKHIDQAITYLFSRFSAHSNALATLTEARDDTPSIPEATLSERRLWNSFNALEKRFKPNSDSDAAVAEAALENLSDLNMSLTSFNSLFHHYLWVLRDIPGRAISTARAKRILIDAIHNPALQGYTQRLQADVTREAQAASAAALRAETADENGLPPLVPYVSSYDTEDCLEDMQSWAASRPAVDNWGARGVQTVAAAALDYIPYPPAINRSNPRAQQPERDPRCDHCGRIHTPAIVPYHCSESTCSCCRKPILRGIWHSIRDNCTFPQPPPRFPSNVSQQRRGPRGSGPRGGDPLRSGVTQAQPPRSKKRSAPGAWQPQSLKGAKQAQLIAHYAQIGAAITSTAGSN